MSWLDRLLCALGLHDQMIEKRTESTARGFIRTTSVTNCARCGRHGSIERREWSLPS